MINHKYVLSLKYIVDFLSHLLLYTLLDRDQLFYRKIESEPEPVNRNVVFSLIIGSPKHKFYLVFRPLVISNFGTRIEKT